MQRDCKPFRFCEALPSRRIQPRHATANRVTGHVPELDTRSHRAICYALVVVETQGAKGGTMSKLLDKLEQLSEGRAQPLGFSSAASRTRILPMLLVACVPVENAGLAALAASEGADALLFLVENWKKERQALAQISGTKADIPWGVSLKTVGTEEISQLTEMECDFAVFTPDRAPAALLREEKIGKVLQIDPSLGDNLVKAISRLSVDAVLLSLDGGDRYPLTVHQLMVYERLASVVGKHLLATMPPGLPVDDLESLWSLGVRAVVVDLTVAHPEQRLSQVKEAIQKLPTTRKRPGEKISAVLPAYREGPAEAPTEPDEDDDI